MVYYFIIIIYLPSATVTTVLPIWYSKTNFLLSFPKVIYALISGIKYKGMPLYVIDIWGEKDQNLAKFHALICAAFR